jgi:hypothetical protein
MVDLLPERGTYGKKWRNRKDGLFGVAQKYTDLHW